jgi:quercetin dioxygenase-like cupin family protein
LVMLAGAINFSISERELLVQEGQSFSFPAHEKHHVVAKEDSKFLIIR